MRIDEAKLRAYLDGELTTQERVAVEKSLVDSPQAQAALAQLRQQTKQLHQGLDSLAPTAETRSPAGLALKRFKAQLKPTSQAVSSTESGSPPKPDLVWESPSLLAELKTTFKEFRLNNWRQSMQRGFVLVAIAVLMVVVSAIFVVIWPEIGWPAAEPAHPVASSDQVNAPVNESKEQSMTTVLVALQPISRGSEFGAGSIGRRSWPTQNLPAGFVTDETATTGKAARTDIAQGQVIVQGMLVDAAKPDTPELPAGVTPILAIFNYEIELVGYKLATKNVTPGDPLELTLYWRSLQPIKNDYTVFIHLADPERQTIMIQEDSPPAQGKFPTHQWRPGGLIEDQHQIATVDHLPEGAFDLVVGLYNSATFERLTLPSANNSVSDSAIVLTQVQIRQVEAKNSTSASADILFGYGIQADPNGDSELNISSIEELGFEWVKFQMPWKAVEPSPGRLEWEAWDSVIEAYAAQGIKVMLHIVKAPDWARPADDDKNVEGLPADPATYAKFVTQVVERYQGKVQAIEVWDEQNLWYKAGGKGGINPIDYVKLLQQAYPAIKAVNQDTLIISGGLTPTSNIADPTNDQLFLTLDDVDYLKQMYANGAKDYFDALGAHPGGNNCPALADWRTVTPEEAGAASFLEPFTKRHRSWCFLGTLEAYREVMLANDDGGKAIAITQFGWAVGDSPQPGYQFALDNTPAERAKWIVEAYQWGKKQGWVGPMVLWNLDYSLTTPVSELSYFSIYYTSAYEALAKMQK
jgi:anti-sigma factor RsiW